MKSYQLIVALMLIPLISNAQMAYLDNDTNRTTVKRKSQAKKSVAAPKFLPKNTADAFVVFNYKKNDDHINLNWRLNKSFKNKTFHLLRGVMNEKNHIKWKIIEAFGPLNEQQVKFQYQDQEVFEMPTFYRLRVSEDGDMVEYTSFYSIQ